MNGKNADIRPSWVGLTGLCSLLFAIMLVVLILLTMTGNNAPLVWRDYVFWALLISFWLSPILFGYAFVLTIIRSEAADWRRGCHWFLAGCCYLIVAAVIFTRP